MKKAVLFVENSFQIPLSFKLPSFYQLPLEKYQKSEQSVLLSLIPKLQERYDLTIIALDHESKNILKNIPHQFGPHLIDVAKIDEKSMQFVRSLSKKPEIRKIFSYDGYDLWTGEEVNIWEYFLFACARRVEIIKKVLADYHPDTIIISNRFSDLGKIVLSFPDQKEDYTSTMSAIYHRARTVALPTALRFFYRELKEIFEIKKPSRGQKNNIMLFTDTARIISSTLPWSKELKKEQVLTIGTSPRFSEEFEKQGLSFSSFSEYLTRELKEKIKKQIQFFAKFRKNNTLRVVYEGIDITSALSELFDYLFIIGIPRTIAYIEILNEIITKEKPKVGVVYGDRMNFGKTACAVCSRNNIPTVIIQLGMINESPVFGPITATKMAVFGNQMKRILIQRGNNPAQLAVTGQPRFDPIVTGKFNRLAIYGKFKIPQSKKIILFTSQGFHDENDKKMFSSLFAAVKEIPEVQLIIKLHPDENPAFAENLKKKYFADAIITKENLYGLLYASSVVVTYFSTTAWEALLFDKPLIILNFTGEKEKIDCVREGAALGVSNEGDLLQTLMRALWDKQIQQQLQRRRRMYCYDHTYKNDGLASRRVASLIEGIVK